MFSTCLFCHGPLGANQSIEHFPVGRRLAFDAERGRLWAVCPRCARWNLSPLEERWEAIEECERAYRGTTQRVSTDNIALARLKDGTDLVRIGRPLLPEFAAWRYGDQLGVRRKRYRLVHTYGAGSLSSLHVLGMSVAALGAFSTSAVFPYMSSIIIAGNVASAAAEWVRNRPVAQVQVEPAQHVAVRADEVSESKISFDEKGVVQLQLRARVKRQYAPIFTRKQLIVLSGDAALRALSQAIVGVNYKGATRPELESAVKLIDDGQNVENLLTRVANHTFLSSDYYRGMFAYTPPEQRIALEMLLHEADERRAMAGELGDLYARWQDAERVAKVADGELTPLPSNES